MSGPKIRFLILLAISFNLASSDQAYGTSCTLKNGSSGICVDISNCREIKKLLTERKISRYDITICNKVLRYLCCPLPPAEGENPTSKVPNFQELITTTETSKSTESKSDSRKFSQEDSSEAGKEAEGKDNLMCRLLKSETFKELF